MAKVRAVYEPEYAERAAETERRQQELDILRKGVRGLGQTALDALAKGDMPSFTWLSHQIIEQRLAVDREWKVFALLANQLLSSRNVLRPEIVEDLLYSVKEKLRLDSRDGTTVVLAGSIFRYLSGIDNHEPKSELERAIEVMTQFINVKKSAKEIDEDMGGVLYNRACYRAILRESIGNQDESLSRRLLETALEDLRIAVGIQPFLGKRATQDDDLASLRGNQEFQAIVGGGIAP
jgi:hypothetical protein